MKEHSNVFYIFTKSGSDTCFEAVQKAQAVKSDFGLDLFRYDGKVYEGQTGLIVVNRLDDLPSWVSKMQEENAVTRLNERIEEVLKTTGLSPRYTRPDERKDEIFPQKAKDDDIVFARAAHDGKKHYYRRFYNENGVELFSLKNDTDSSRSVFIMCEGFMLNIGGYYQVDEILLWLSGLENGLKAAVERQFNESMANPMKWVNLPGANVLGRFDEANAHNEVIRETRQRERDLEAEERKAKRLAEEATAAKEYEQAIANAEQAILRKEKLLNANIQGKSLIMQLIRKYGISVPLKTQGWIIKTLHDIYCYDNSNNKWSYHYCGNDSTVFSKYLKQLVATIFAASEGI